MIFFGSLFMKQIYWVDLNSIWGTGVWKVFDLSWSKLTSQSINSRWHLDVVILVPFRSSDFAEIHVSDNSKIALFWLRRLRTTEQNRSGDFLQRTCNQLNSRDSPGRGMLEGNGTKVGTRTTAGIAGNGTGLNNLYKHHDRDWREQWPGSSKNFSSLFWAFWQSSLTSFLSLSVFFFLLLLNSRYSSAHCLDSKHERALMSSTFYFQLRIDICYLHLCMEATDCKNSGESHCSVPQDSEEPQCNSKWLVMASPSLQYLTPPN